MQPDYKAIGKRVQKRRTAKKISQAELAKKISVTSPHISNIERGKTKVSLPTLMEIARALNTTLDDLVCDSLPEAKDVILGDFSDTLRSCSNQELGIISDVTKALLQSMRTRKSTEREQAYPKQGESE
ncbi:helix-turn-helix domain-containing protein [uncultured Acetatifactor sp.]|uniref:helix-turn-helix domain-containing protein n=1 Tax=uncultured Acetatifactor sp. TaxID=1671927 RepID=UPI00261F59E9|nr:helix-turn-helix transcriptional regulator [uncultured Acetatifactor sp.]